NSLRRAGGRRDHVQSSGARTAKVLVRQVEDALVVGVAVDGGHQRTLNFELVVDDLRRRGEAVGRAGSVGDDVVVGRVVLLFVDAETNGDVFAFGRSRNDDLLRARFQVLGRRVTVGKAPRAFDDDVAAQVAPRQLGGVALG